MLKIKDQKSLEVGLTLIEVLIALAILSTVAFVSIPNVRRFNQLQEIKEAADNLASFLTQAQSKAISSIECSNGNPAINRRVLIRPAGYSLTTSCWIATSPPNPSPTADGAVPPSGTYPASITVSATFCPTYSSGSGNNVDIVFENKNIRFICFPPGGGEDDITPRITTTYFEITIRDSRNGSNQFVRIDKGGAISVTSS